MRQKLFGQETAGFPLGVFGRGGDVGRGDDEGMLRQAAVRLFFCACVKTGYNWGRDA